MGKSNRHLPPIRTCNLNLDLIVMRSVPMYIIPILI